MPVPAFGAAGVIPPFRGDPRLPDRSPYSATAREVVEAFGTSLPRCKILSGWLKYREEMRKHAAAGFQWVAGSFCEDVSFRVPPRDPPEPADIDVVTFVRIPHGLNADCYAEQILAQPQLFNPLSKELYKCDAYLGTVVDANHVELAFATYWYGLFSHRRNDFQWKGLLSVDLISDDAEALAALNEIEESLAQPIPVAVGEP